MNKNLFFLAIVFLVASIELKSQTIVINEFMADNAETISDPNGDFDDWIEVFNFGNEPVDIGGLYITDDFADPTKYQIPQGNDSTIIQPQSFLLIWADDDTEQGVLHIGIKLSKSGEQIAIIKSDGATYVDSITFGQQETDVSYGRQPNGASTWMFFNDPTPGWSNGTTGFFISKNETFSICPNPASKMATIHFPFIEEKAIEICDLKGNQVLFQKISDSDLTFNCELFPKGLYLIKVVSDKNIIYNGKLIIE